MEFVGDLLNNSKGIHWYYIIGLLIFIFLFIVIVYRTSKMSKSDIAEFKESILEKDDNLK